MLERRLPGRLIAVLMAAILPGIALSVLSAAQDRASEAKQGSINAARFISFAHSSAQLQERASALAAQRDTRPEVKAFASEMKEFRTQQSRRLMAFANEHGLATAEMTAPYKVLLENLEPLDFLALSRRYAELEVQALGQEIQGFEKAVRDTDDSVARLAAEFLPKLREWLLKARQMQEAIRS